MLINKAYKCKKDIPILSSEKNLKEIDSMSLRCTLFDLNNDYYASVLVGEEITESIITPTKIIGLDLGIKDIVTKNLNIRNYTCHNCGCLLDREIIMQQKISCLKG